MIQLSKTFEVEMAHKLVSSYSSKCTNIHGHSYKIEVTLCGDALDSDGMLVDFGKVKDEIGELFQLLDHSMMISAKETKLCDFLEGSYYKKWIKTSFNPTSENLGLWLFKLVQNRIGCLFYKLESIKISETCTSRVEITEMGEPAGLFADFFEGGRKCQRLQ